MGRAEKRKFVKRFKDVSSVCPICKKKSVFCTDKGGMARCIMCGNQVIDKKLDNQCFIKLKQGESNGENTNSNRPIKSSIGDKHI